MNGLTPKQVNPPNPTGKGGFKDNPQNRNDGRWHTETSIGWNYNKLIRCSVNQFKQWVKDHPEEERTIAEELAYQAIIKAREDLGYLKEVTDRTEGKAVQNVQMNVNDVTSELNKLESDYDKLGSEAERQMVEAYPSVQDQG